MNILISGAGIAGLTSAFWLNNYGFNVTLIERAPQIRDEGYMVDFYGEGVQVAKAMGILDKLYELSSDIKDVNIIDDVDHTIGGFKIADIQHAMVNANSGYMPLMRGHLERTIYETLPDDMDIRFGTTIKSIENLPNAATVTFTDGKVENFDMVIGAEGIHSSTRELLFGDQQQFLVPMGAQVAIVRLKGVAKNHIGHAKTNVNVGNFIATVPTKDGDLIAILAYHSDQKAPHKHDEALAKLKSVYSPKNRYAHDIINQITDDTYIYIDDVAQIRMPEWCQGRVALIGDASACLTLLSGQGSLMAMAEAYILARELSLAKGDHKIAYKAYDDILRPIIDKKAIAATKVSVLIPKTWLGLKLFRIMSRFMKLKFIQKMLFGAYMKPTIFDKSYPLESAK